MSMWENIKSWFRSESTAAREWSDDLERDLSADLARKETDLRATPEEKLENLQDQISGNTDAFDDIKGRIAAAGIDVDGDQGVDHGVDRPGSAPAEPDESDESADRAGDNDD